MSIRGVIGQERVKLMLQAAIRNNRVAHSYLFHGPSGVGKDAMAFALAQALNCNEDREDACGRCEECVKFQTLSHPNLSLVFALPVGKEEKTGDSPLAKLSADEIELVREQLRLKAGNPYHNISLPRATTIKVNSIRDLRRQAALTVHGKGKKVFVILDAENLNDESANALLKTVEEPTPSTHLILTTSKKENLLPTIISRCQSVRFDILSDEAIAGYLHTKHNIASEQAGIISRLSNGSMSRAIALLDADLQKQREQAVEFLRCISRWDLPSLSKFIEDLVREYDRTEIGQILILLGLWLRDAMTMSEEIQSIVNLDQKESIERFMKRYPNYNYGYAQQAVESAISLVSRNVYIPLVFYTLTVELKKAISHIHSVEA